MKKFLKWSWALLLALLLLVGCNTAGSPAATASPVPEASAAFPDGLTVRFFDVGQGDSALLTCRGKSLLIDTGSSDSPVVSLLASCGITRLDYLMVSHAHEDHDGCVNDVLKRFPTDVLLAPLPEKLTFLPESVTAQPCTAGMTFPLGDASVTVLGPIAPEKAENENDTSIVCMVQYGQARFLFTGDAGTAEETELLESGCSLSATVLKVGHHGSSSSTGYRFLREVMPEFAVISVGEGNSYGHPTEAALSRLRDASVTVFRTDQDGTVVLSTDGEQLHIRRGEEALVLTPEPSAVPGLEGNSYIGNMSSHVFHRSDCASLPAEKNRVYFAEREDAVNAGYTPCSRCNP